VVGEDMDVVDYNYELCNKIHADLDRRIGTVEQALAESASRQEDRLQRIHTRFDEVSKDMQTRLPGWATIVIAALSAASVGLAVASVK